jgi:hypothetical protein
MTPMGEIEDVQNPILYTFSRGPNRLFRMNAGLAWSGVIVQKTPKLITLANYGAVKLGPPGFSDIFGWTEGGIATLIECKYGKRKPTEEQLNFLAVAKAAGCRAGVAYSVADAENIIYAPRSTKI